MKNDIKNFVVGEILARRRYGGQGQTSAPPLGVLGGVDGKTNKAWGKIRGQRRQTPSRVEPRHLNLAS